VPHTRTRVTSAAAAVASCCLAAAACGASASSAGAGSASPSQTADPLSGLTGNAINTKATADAEAAASVRMNGTVAESGQSYAIDLAIKRGQGCTGTIGLGSKGSIKLIVIGATIYMKADSQFWTANAGAQAPAVIATINNRYLEVPSSNKDLGSLANLCNLSKLLTGDAGKPDSYVREPLTTLAGVRVVPLKVSDGSTEYVTDTSTPQFVEATSPKSAQQSGTMTVSVDVPVTLAAPPASQVLNGSTIGL
jgi:hypothetical protein